MEGDLCHSRFWYNYEIVRRILPHLDIPVIQKNILINYSYVKYNAQKLSKNVNTHRTLDKEDQTKADRPSGSAKKHRDNAKCQTIAINIRKSYIPSTPS